jgi:hypothetical protein
MCRGGGPADSSQPVAMAGGEWRLGLKGVARDPLEVSGGGVGGGSPSAVHSGAARQGEADDVG